MKDKRKEERDKRKDAGITFEYICMVCVFLPF